jgi:hypothetical protein
MEPITRLAPQRHRIGVIPKARTVSHWYNHAGRRGARGRCACKLLDPVPPAWPRTAPGCPRLTVGPEPDPGPGRASSSDLDPQVLPPHPAGNGHKGAGGGRWSVRQCGQHFAVRACHRRSPSTAYGVVGELSCAGSPHDLWCSRRAVTRCRWSLPQAAEASRAARVGSGWAGRAGSQWRGNRVRRGYV